MFLVGLEEITTQHRSCMIDAPRDIDQHTHIYHISIHMLHKSSICSSWSSVEWTVFNAFIEFTDYRDRYTHNYIAGTNFWQTHNISEVVTSHIQNYHIPILIPHINRQITYLLNTSITTTTTIWSYNFICTRVNRFNSRLHLNKESTCS